jgi:membrane-bound inhibitor of C-type lysozyme
MRKFLVNWLCPVVLCLFLGACGGDDMRRNYGGADIASDNKTRTLVYDCNGYEFVARLGAGEMALWLEEGYVVLSQVRSASGTAYEEGDISFWSKGEEAILNVGESSYQNCHQLPARVPWEDARRRGVDFRGVGNETGWTLEVQSGRQLLFVEDYGLKRVIVSDQGQDSVGAMRFHRGVSEGHALQVEIIEAVCVDTMSGEMFPSSVRVTLDGAHYQGCGRPLGYPWYDLE